MPIPVSPQVSAALEALSNTVFDDGTPAAYCSEVVLTMSYQDYATLIELLREKEISIGSSVEGDWEYEEFSSRFYRYRYAPEHTAASRAALAAGNDEALERTDEEVTKTSQCLDYPPALIKVIGETDFSGSGLKAESFIPPRSVLRERKTIRFGLTNADAVAIQEHFLPFSPSSTGESTLLFSSGSTSDPRGRSGSDSISSATILARLRVPADSQARTTPRDRRREAAAAPEGHAESDLCALPPLRESVAASKAREARRRGDPTTGELWSKLPKAKGAAKGTATCAGDGSERRYGLTAAALRLLAGEEVEAALLGKGMRRC